MKADNFASVVARFIQALKVPVTSKSVREQLLIHPDYGTFRAISDVLDNWKIPNAAYCLKFDQLADVPTPYIAQLKGAEFAVVTKRSERAFVVSNEDWRNKSLTIEEFRDSYSGYILVAEKEAHSAEPGYLSKRMNEVLESIRIPFVIACIIFFLISFFALNSSYLRSFNARITTLLLIKTCGVLVSMVLLIQNIDENNPLIQKICGAKEQRCNAILSSRAAKITAQLSWSEVGFFYFAGTWLLTLFSQGSLNYLATIALLNALALPYTFFSIYYQGVVAKQWCVLCCSVQAIFWIEFFLTSNQLFHHFNFNGWRELYLIFLLLAVPVIMWIFVKPYLAASKQIAPLQLQLQQFKFNRNRFHQLLEQEANYKLPDGMDTLILGDPDAKLTLTMVSDPFCGPCAKIHRTLEEWLPLRSDIKLQVVFYTPSDEDDERNKVASTLLSLQDTENDNYLRKAMHDWYRKRKFQKWSKKYRKDIHRNTQHMLNMSREWCRMAEIATTPTLFLNGRRLPKGYQSEDLRYFI
ncbi:Peptidase C39 family protein [Mucilaginibacter gossypiicola]|uniref:Peptidase C39 family protein n=1 Tax=Mucilaginibacter gossypiicola TaxID=551995 RepID=A0A1H8B9B3_9SPHI|nr:vitamin K epoxide reductase family protein [Mucilaginibacter gossypiicola]SEM79510.1 Peptidase C39 family protein [Mucilaginibacter gossypiicola]